MLSSSARFFLHTALFLLVLTGVGNIHSHLCLDGQEPAVSVHFENLLHGHPDHADDEAAHVDVDNELIAQVLPGKSLNQDTPLFLAACLFVLCVRRPAQQHYVVQNDDSFYEAPAWLQPAPRAPPHHSS